MPFRGIHSMYIAVRCPDPSQEAGSGKPERAGDLFERRLVLFDNLMKQPEETEAGPFLWSCLSEGGLGPPPSGRNAPAQHLPVRGRYPPPVNRVAPRSSAPRSSPFLAEETAEIIRARDVHRETLAALAVFQAAAALDAATAATARLTAPPPWRGGTCTERLH